MYYKVWLLYLVYYFQILIPDWKSTPLSASNHGLTQVSRHNILSGRGQLSLPHAFNPIHSALP
jgi:hypothetical protein